VTRPQPPGDRKALRWLLAAAAAGALVLALAVPLPHVLRMTRLAHLLDLAHFVAFAFLTAAIAWALAGRIIPAAVVASAIAAGMELVQPLLGRSGNAGDFVRGLLGVLAAAICLSAARPPRTARRAAGGFVLLSAVAAWPIADTAPYLLDAWTEYRSFPVLCDFQTPWQSSRWMTLGTAIRRARSPRDGQWVGRLLIPPREGRSTAILFPMAGDWRGQRRLCCDFDVSEGAVTIAVRLRTGDGQRKHMSPCFEARCGVGSHHVSATLPASYAADDRADLSRVHSLYFFLSDNDRSTTVDVRRVYLQ
jgi:hypothetical protein